MTDTRTDVGESGRLSIVVVVVVVWLDLEEKRLRKRDLRDLEVGDDGGGVAWVTGGGSNDVEMYSSLTSSPFSFSFCWWSVVESVDESDGPPPVF